MAVGPDSLAELENDNDENNDWLKLQYFELNHRLHLLILVQVQNSKYQLSFDINTQDNTYKVSFPKLKTENEVYNKAASITNRPEFYFYIYSACKKCGQSSCNSKEISFDFQTKTIINLGIEEEIRILYDQEMIFNLNYNWNSQYIEVFRYKDSELSKKEPSSFHIPMTDLDFSNQEKLIDKLKTLHFFS